MSKSYFITGGNGQLGSALKAKYPLATVVDRTKFDISDPAIYKSIDWTQYDTLINAAAMTNVDGAETPEGRELAWKVNASAVGLLAKTATAHGLTLVHISSEYVFDGTKDNHSEDEPFTPLGVYGQSKAAGDIAAATVPKHYVLRTSWVIGEGKNFVSIMNNLAGRDIKPSVVDDQIGRLTFVSTITDAIEHVLTTAPSYGTYNCSNDGESAAWSDIAQLVFEKTGKNKSDVSRVSTEEYYAGKSGIAPRPLRSTMDLTKLKSTGFNPTDWREDLEKYWNTMEEQS